MTLSSRHMIRNSSPGGPRPSSYLSVTEAPHNTEFHTWMGKKHFCFFQTAASGNRTPNSSVKGSGANHYPRAPALADGKSRDDLHEACKPLLCQWTHNKINWFQYRSKIRGGGGWWFNKSRHLSRALIWTHMGSISFISLRYHVWWVVDSK